MISKDDERWKVWLHNFLKGKTGEDEGETEKQVDVIAQENPGRTRLTCATIRKAL